jgi:hypothetical protein
MEQPDLATNPRILVVMIDGLGDRTWPELDDRTPLEAARTPNLDALARASAAGILHSLGPGRAPGTELAHFVLLGYPVEEYPGRVVFEAAGCGFELSPADVAFRALFSKVRREADGSLTLVEHFAAVEEQLCRELTEQLGSLEHEGLTVSLDYTGARQGVLTVSGGASEDVTDCDPFFAGRPLAAVRPLDNAADPIAARLTAAAVTAFLGNAYRVFRESDPSGGRRVALPRHQVGRPQARTADLRSAHGHAWSDRRFRHAAGRDRPRARHGLPLHSPRTMMPAPTSSSASSRRVVPSLKEPTSSSLTRSAPTRPGTPRTRRIEARRSSRQLDQGIDLAGGPAPGCRRTPSSASPPTTAPPRAPASSTPATRSRSS